MPDWKREITERLAALNLSPAREAEIVEELAEHLQDRYIELQAAGTTQDEAYRAALAEMSQSHQLTRELSVVERPDVPDPVTSGTRIRRVASELWQDLRYGVRMLLKQPGFTIAAVITLAFGIGANTAIFSVVDAVLLRPLPFRDPSRLVWFWGVQPALAQTSFSAADFLDYQAQNTSFEEMAAYRNLSFTLTGDGDPERIDGRIVSANYFALLGVETTVGRCFTPDDGQAGAARVAILSYALWQGRFNKGLGIIGRTLFLNGESATVIGIMPADFNETDVDLWTNPKRIVPDFSTTSRDDILTQRATFYLRVLGRLRPGVTLALAQADIDSVAARLRQQYPQTNAVRGVRLVSLYEKVVGDVRPMVLVLFGAVALVLLIACANVANLAAVRAMSRARETATRLALGASASRIIRQSLTESVLLAGLGGVCGWLLAEWGVQLLLALSPTLPRLSEVGLDRRIFGFTLMLSLLTGIIFGLFPALLASRTDVDRTLKEHGRSTTATGKRIRIRGVLVAAQVALAFVVLIGAGLLIKSFAKLQSVAPGFDPTNLTTVLIWLSDEKYVDRAPRVAFLKELIRRLDALPGVQGVAIANDLPIRGTDASNYAVIEGRPEQPPGGTLVGVHVVGPRYFQAMGIPVLSGRELNERDDERAPAVIVINETAARLFWPGQDAIGKRLKVEINGNRWIEVVGITGDVKFDGLDEEAGPHVYASILQNPWAFRVALRSRLEPAIVGAAVQHEVQAIDSTQPVSHIKTMDQVMSDSVARRRFSLILFSLFAGIALLMAAVGIYGVVACAVGQRTHEIGIRMALGAEAKDVLRLIIGQGMKLTVIGLAIGSVVAVAFTRMMAGLLFHVSATDPVTFIIVGSLLAVIAFVACWVPAQHANVDPMIALRSE
jgi:putative ABC transport system permease protein